jgi:hypothetical protein
MYAMPGTPAKKDPAAFGPQDLVDALSDIWKSLREGRDL